MKVLVVEPQKPCRVQEIESLPDMQQLVGGDIEAVYPFQEPVALVCNSEGKLLGLPMNRPLLDKDYLPYRDRQGRAGTAASIGRKPGLLTGQVQLYRGRCKAALPAGRAAFACLHIYNPRGLLVLP